MDIFNTFLLIIADEGFTFLTNNLSKKIFRNLIISMLFLRNFSRNINEFNLIDKVPILRHFHSAFNRYLKENIEENLKIIILILMTVH